MTTLDISRPASRVLTAKLRVFRLNRTNDTAPGPANGTAPPGTAPPGPCDMAMPPDTVACFDEAGGEGCCTAGACTVGMPCAAAPASPVCEEGDTIHSACRLSCSLFCML